MKKIIQGQIKLNISLKLKIQKEAKDVGIPMSSFVHLLFREYMQKKLIDSKNEK